MKKNMVIVIVLIALGASQSLQSSGHEKYRWALDNKPAQTRWFGLGQEPDDFLRANNNYDPSNEYGYGRNYHNLGKDAFVSGFGKGNVFGQHVGRYEGTKNTLLTGAALYGTYLAGKFLYQWYRGPLRHIKNKLQHLANETKNLITYINDHDKKTSSHFMNNILAASVDTEMDIHGRKGVLPVCKDYLEQLLKKLETQEDDFLRANNNYDPSNEYGYGRNYHNLAKDALSGFGKGNVFGQHVGRYEGTKNTLLTGAALYGTYLAGKSLYQWYRGPLHHRPLHHIKNKLQHLANETKNLITYINDHDKKTSSHFMNNILAASVDTEIDIHGRKGVLPVCKDYLEQLLKKLETQEAEDKAAAK
jgi:uncharacterized membrane protein